MPKGSFWNDTFEKLEELGSSTVKSTGDAVKQTFSPGSILEHVTGIDTAPHNPNQAAKKDQQPDKGATQLNLEELKKKYENQDQQKTEALRNRLFQLVKSGDEKVAQDKEREKKEKEQQLMYEEQNKHKKEEEQKQREAESAPQGKIRKSVLGGKKRKAQVQTIENKPAGKKH